MHKNKKHSKHHSKSASDGGEVRRDVAERVAVEGRWSIVGDGKPPSGVVKKYN
jgi:hypothetical protein